MKASLLTKIGIVLVLYACSSTPRNTELWTERNIFPDGDDWAIENNFEYSTFVEVLSKFKEEKGYIIYDIKDEAIGLYYVDFIHYNRIFLRNNARLQLLTLIDKYLQWEEQAKKNMDTLEKNIGNVETYCYWNIKNGEMYKSHKANLNVSFLSQNKNRHQLVLVFPTYNSMSNQFITHKPETLYLEKNSAINLKNLLSDKSVKESISKIIKNQESKKEKYN
ncbi:hypothetical protein [Leptospira levettii]|uniref:hypothetical protein n=1 Tax=Leptospira levettii TaxID=2023178 RepID=UPI001083C1EC|nr:hypothetical protein [Leptospira levettii]TGK97249.1 hypothetical protein EHQ34_02615 [Leptospira levettii]